MRKSQEGRALRQFTLSTGKSAGRNSSGRITRGGGSKRLQRRIDLKRSTSLISFLLLIAQIRIVSILSFFFVGKNTTSLVFFCSSRVGPFRHGWPFSFCRRGWKWSELFDTTAFWPQHAARRGGACPILRSKQARWWAWAFTRGGAPLS